MAHVIWRQAALDQIIEIFDYLHALNPVAAMKVTDHIRIKGNRLQFYPERGRRVRGTRMREITTSFPYVIRYRVEGDTVFILRIRHTARRPTKP